jgi:acetyl-CoA carboxylase biotin carboxyl carrier protein
MALTDEDVREILRIIDSSPLSEIRVQTRGFSLHVVKEGAEAEAATDAGASDPAASDPAASDPAASDPAPPVRDERPAAGRLVTIAAPMLGMFYAADGPGERPFVQVGDLIEPDTTVCIIEVMKMMNSVPAGVSGTVAEVCAANGDLVEEGAPLFVVAPS